MSARNTQLLCTIEYMASTRKLPLAIRELGFPQKTEVVDLRLRYEPLISVFGTKMSQRLTLSGRLRHLRPSHISTLSLMLDPFDEWKNLACRIVTRTGHPMFYLDKINYINHRTKMSGQSATEEILKSWFAANPSIDDLRTILCDMNMRRAVEYIDNEILSVSGDVSTAPVRGDTPSTPTS